jgi:putative phosphoribosyl transferase
MSQFLDRRDAGQQLASALTKYARQPNVMVVGLPRGGVPVASEVANALGQPLDVLIVRKLGVPGQRELAMGAISSGGIRELNSEVIEAAEISPQEVERITRIESRELERREQTYRPGRPRVKATGKTVILVDDGLATGTTMLAAITAIRALGAEHVTVAVPVGSPESCRRVAEKADELICLLQPEDLHAIGLWYEDFRQTTDDEVRKLMAADS